MGVMPYWTNLEMACMQPAEVRTLASFPIFARCTTSKIPNLRPGNVNLETTKEHDLRPRKSTWA